MSDLDRFRGSLLPTLSYVQSSNVIGIGYDKVNEDLYVIFGNKKVYKYSGVEEETFNKLYDSRSKGKFLASTIKPNYKCDVAYKTDGYLITDYKETKIVITDLDDGRGYVYIDGEKHKLFDASPGVKDDEKSDNKSD